MEKGSLQTLAIAVVAVVLMSAGIAVTVQSEDGDTIRIGVLPVIDTLPLYVAQEQGLFEREGVNVELVQFSSAAECITSFTAGKIDGYFGDLIKTLILKGSGADVKVVTAVHHTSDHRMFALLAPPGEGEIMLSDIGGMEVATSTGTIVEYLLDEMLTDAPDNVRKIEVPPIPSRMQSLDKGMLTFLPEPFVTMAIAAGAREVANDTQYNMTTSIIALKGSFVSAHPDLAKGFLTAYNESVALVNEGPARYAGILKSRLSFPEGLIGTFDFPPLSATTLPRREEVSKVEDWMINYPSGSKLTGRISYESIMAIELYEGGT